MKAAAFARTAFANGHMYSSSTHYQSLGLRKISNSTGAYVRTVRSSTLDEIDSYCNVPFAKATGFLRISCSLRSQCLAVACTPASCMPWMACSMLIPLRYGSGEKPSQLRPEYAERPIGPTEGLLNRRSISSFAMPTCSNIDLRKRDLSSLGPELAAHRNGPVVHQLPIPGGRDGHSARVHADEISRAEGGRAILETETAKVEARNRVNITHTGTRLASDWATLAWQDSPQSELR